MVKAGVTQQLQIEAIDIPNQSICLAHIEQGLPCQCRLLCCLLALADQRLQSHRKCF